MFIKWVLIPALLVGYVQCQGCSSGDTIIGTKPETLTGNAAPFTTSFVQIYEWMQSPCDGSATYLEYGVLKKSNKTRRFYVGAFQPLTIANQRYFKLETYITVDVPPDAYPIGNLSIREGEFFFKAGNSFGIFYDQWNTAQDDMVVPYAEIFGAAAVNYNTYVGPHGLNEMNNINQLRLGGELSIIPVARQPSLALTIQQYTAAVTFPDKNCGTDVPAVRNAYVSFQSFDTVAQIGDTVEYHCEFGYRLKIGKFYRIKCQEPEVKWSELPECLPENLAKYTTTPPSTAAPFIFTRAVRLCPRMAGFLPNGRVVSRTFSSTGSGGVSPGQELTFGCNGGYAIEGDERVFCRTDGTWSQMPRCKVQKTPCNYIPKPSNAYLYRQTNPLGSQPVEGDIVTFRCKQGYINDDGSDVINLNCSGGLWNIEKPDCKLNILPGVTHKPIIRVYSCGEPPRFDNALITKQSYPAGSQSIPGDFVTYTCTNNNDMIGNGKAQCLGDLSWNVEFECKPGEARRGLFECGAPLEINHANEIARRLRNPSSGIGIIGDLVIYACNENYVRFPSFPFKLFLTHLALENDWIGQCLLFS